MNKMEKTEKKENMQEKTEKTEKKENMQEKTEKTENISFEKKETIPIDIHDLSYQYNYIKKSDKSTDEIEAFHTFTKSVSEAYLGAKTQNSTALDLIAVYLKGQKILYIDAKTYCENSLNYLMLPAIFISSACTVLSIGLKSYYYGALIVSALTGFNAFLLGIISYLKLDAKAEAHKTTSYQFDKLQTMCEFLSGKVLLIDDDHMREKVHSFVENVEKKVEEIKDTNQFIIPEAIRHRYPIIYSYNVFAKLKSYRMKEKYYRNELMSYYNQIDALPINHVNLPDLIEKKNKKLQDIFSCRNQYLEIDRLFNYEIKNYILYKRNRWKCLHHLIRVFVNVNDEEQTKILLSRLNTIIDNNIDNV